MHGNLMHILFNLSVDTISSRVIGKMGNSNSCRNLGIPSAKGPNTVGCSDFMMDHTVGGVFFRLYYPCVASEGAERPDWIPRKEYLYGLADFMKYNRTLSERIFDYLFGRFKIPADLDAPYKQNGKYPVIIFSHGLGAFRTLYSAICVELASQGFIVAAVEHRDESASATFFYEKNEDQEKKKASCKSAPNPNNPKAPDGLVERWMYYRSLKPGETEFPLRNQQVKKRADECIAALDKLIEINSGKTMENVLQTKFDWTTLENSMDLCKITVMGHSFGGATVIEALCKEVKFKCGIALDSWMFPLDDEIYVRVKQPIFFINSEKFQWAGNIMRMRKLESSSTSMQRKMITIMGTVHQSFPDFTFLTGSWIGKILKLKGELDPEVGIDLCNRASLAFLQRHLGLDKDFNQWDHLIEGKDINLIPGTNVTEIS
ncbi:hypothetical protein UPYG_G00254990 [Umbra pygmaea]|uniref:Platelet-activating factor acetylhydrolase n=1 Tax=Umbra pygmaea TaxID=75934 RepID=A0ABD0WYB7_UMBPY